MENIRYLAQDIPSYTFYGVKSNSTTGIAVATYAPNSYLSHIYTIGESAFESSDVVSFETAPGDGVSATTIAAKAFRNATKFKGYSSSSQNISNKVIEFNNVSTIGEKAFEGTAAKYVIVGEEITSIGESAFGKMKSLTSYDTYLIGGLPKEDAENDYEYYFGYVFTQEGGDGTDFDEKVEWKKGSTTRSYYLANYLDYTFRGEFIEDRAFYGASDYVYSLGLTDSVTSIGDYAFYNCKIRYGTSARSNDEPFEIPSSVTSIGNYAFAASRTDIIAMNTVTFNMDDGEDLEIGEYAFYMNGSITSIELPNRLVSIGAHSLEKCGNLTTYSAPFVGCDGTNDSFKYLVGNQTDTTTSISIVFVTFDGNSETLEQCTWPKSLKNIAITGTVVADYAFAIFTNNNGQRGSTVLESVSLPNVEQLGMGAFYCTQIGSIEMNCEDLQSVGAYSFYNAKLNQFTVYDSLQTVGCFAFYGTTLSSADEPLEIALDEDYEASWEGEYYTSSDYEHEILTATQDSLPNALKNINDYNWERVE